MTLKHADLDLNSFENLSDLPRLEKNIAIWESDPEAFEKLDKEIDLEEEMFSLLNELEKKNLVSEIERLDRAIQCQAERYKNCRKYISQTLIPLYLAEDRENSTVQKTRIENYLKPFYEFPDKDYEIFSDVLFKLICYDQSSISIDLCKETYTKIANSTEFFINPKDEIAEIIVWNELQDAFLSLKKNVNIDWFSCNQKCTSYGYIFSKDDFKGFEEVMLGRLDRAQMFKAFKDKTPLIIFQLKLAFCCQMYELDGTSFVTSNYFASNVMDFLANIPGRKNCPLQTFFKIKPNMLTPYVIEINAGWFDQTYKQFAFLGGLHIFYLVLLKIGIIEMKTIEEFFPNATVLKSEYKKINLDSPWTFNFIHKLEEQLYLLIQSHRDQTTV